MAAGHALPLGASAAAASQAPEPQAHAPPAAMAVQHGDVVWNEAPGARATAALTTYRHSMATRCERGISWSSISTVKATTACTTSDHHCSNQDATTVMPSELYNKLHKKEVRVVGSRVLAFSACRHLIFAYRHVLVRRRVAAANIWPRHTVSQGGSCLHACVFYLSIFDELGAQPR